MKVVLVHDWLIHMRGGEKVLEAMLEVFPDAPIYTLFSDRKKLSSGLQNAVIENSFLQSIPGIRHFYPWLLPLLPWVIRTLKIPAADLVISSSHCVAKGVKIPEGAQHICYCHTPMRYLWGFEGEYFGKFPVLLRILIKWILVGLRKWDTASNTGVRHFISNSENVRRRIQTYYGRESEVIYPPFDAGLFQPLGEARHYYLVVSAFVPYKRVDLVIRAFNSLDRQLFIVGSGSMAASYQKLRKSDRIYFLGSVSGPRLRELYAGARALIFPTDEDFGIVPVEAQACGTPVIALHKGGALESVQGGVFFEDQTPEAIQKAVYEFEASVFDRSAIAKSVAGFDKEHFKEKLKTFVASCYVQSA